MDDLKPCPFCCGEDVEHLPDGFGNWLVGCVTCDYRIQCVTCTEEEAIRYWNTRPTEDALTAEVERLKAEMKDIKGHLEFLPKILKSRAGVANYVITAIDKSLANNESEGENDSDR